MDQTYYLNFPFKISSPVKSIKPFYLKNTALARTKDPIILYIGHGDSLDLSILYDHPSRKKLQGSTIQIFFYEWFRYYLYNQPRPLPENKIYFDCEEYPLLRDEILDKLQQFSSQTGIPITVNSCEANISQHLSMHYPNLNLRCLDLQNQTETFSYNLIKRFLPKDEINFKFWCSTNRFAVHRHIVMCYLADKNTKASWAFNVKNIDKKKIQLSKLPWDYLNIGNQILNQKDFYIDQKVNRINVLNYYSSYDADYKGIYSRDRNFLKSLSDCFLSVVLESTFFQPTVPITEKTFDAMFTLTPFIQVNAPYAIRYIKDLGFKTFDQWWDESYDQEENHEERLLKIFETIDYINSMSINQLFDLYQEIIPTLIHNQRHVLNFYKKDRVLP